MRGRLTPLRAIRAKCIDCQAGSYIEVRNCTSSRCPLFHFRLGKNPNRKGVGGNPQLAPKTRNLSCEKS